MGAQGGEGGGVFGELLCSGPRWELAGMKPQQIPGKEGLALLTHGTLCLRQSRWYVCEGVGHICHLGTAVGASHRLCHFLICHEESKALTGLLAPILQRSLRQFPQRSVTMGRN